MARKVFEEDGEWVSWSYGENITYGMPLALCYSAGLEYTATIYMEGFKSSPGHYAAIMGYVGSAAAYLKSYGAVGVYTDGSGIFVSCIFKVASRDTTRL